MFSVPMRRRLAPLLPALAVGCLTFVWLSRLNPPVFPVNDDPIRDQLLVRDCTDLDACHRLGPLSSFGDLYHGAVWLDLLIAVRLLGGDLLEQRLAVLAGLSLTVSLLFVIVWQWLHPSLALPAAVLLGAFLSVDTPATLLINPSVAVLPDVLTAAGLLCYGLSRRRRFLLLAAFWLGIAVSTHTASFSLSAPFLVIAALARPRAWREVALAVAVALLAFAIPSSATLRANFLALAAQGLLLPILAASVAAVLSAIALGSRFRRCSWNGRAWIIGALLVLPFSLILAWLVRHHHFTVVYLHPIQGPAAVALAAIVTLPFAALARWVRPLRWVPTLAAVAVIALVALDVARSGALPAHGSSTWNLAETAVIADRVAERGWTYADLGLHLQGNGCRDLLAGMSIALPPPRARPSPGRRQLQVVKAPREAFASEHDLVALGRSAALVREVESWLQPHALKACRVPIAGGAAPSCTVAVPATAEVHAPERFLFLYRTFAFIERFERERPYLATYEIPLAATAAGTRDLAIAEPPATCAWRITRVEGMRAEGPLPARRVRLRADGAGAGTIVFEKPFGGPECSPSDLDYRYPPCVLETLPGDPLQDLVGRS